MLKINSKYFIFLIQIKCDLHHINTANCIKTPFNLKLLVKLKTCKSLVANKCTYQKDMKFVVTNSLTNT